MFSPVDDAFWNTYYPPNGYNCRCTVVQTSERTTRLGMNKPLPIPELFEVNLAKKKYMFPPNHPYFERAKGRITSEILETLSAESLYIDVVLPKSDTTIKVSAMQTEGEMVKNIETLRILSENGYKDMKLLPDLYSEEAKRRVYPEGQLPPDIKKNADAIIDGTVYEIKVLDNSANRKIRERLSEASEQARSAILRFTALSPTDDIEHIINRIDTNMKKHELKKVIAIFPDDTLHVLEND